MYSQGRRVGYWIGLSGSALVGGVDPVLLEEHLAEVHGVDRRGEVESLARRPPLAAEHQHLLGTLDPLRDRLDVQALAQPQDGADQRGVAAVGEPLDEAAVDL